MRLGVKIGPFIAMSDRPPSQFNPYVFIFALIFAIVFVIWTNA